MNIAEILFLAFLLVAPDSSYAQEEHFKYSPLFERNGGFEIDMSKKTINFGHVNTFVQDCPNDKKFICVLGGGLDFVVPKAKHLKSDVNMWNYGGHTYLVIERFTGPVLSVEGTFWVIDRIRDTSVNSERTPRKRFIYSLERGVIAIAIVLRERNTSGISGQALPDLRDVLVIQGSRGIASQK